MIMISIFTSKMISDHLEGADQPPGSLTSSLQVVIYCFDVRIEILIIENLHLDIHEWILECDLYTCNWPASKISLQCFICTYYSRNYQKSIWPPGGWSWRLARYRYKGHTPIFLQVCLNVGFLWLGIQFSHRKLYLEATRGWSWRPAQVGI